jgi:beta-glucanase (GH16 family)
MRDVKLSIVVLTALVTTHSGTFAEPPIEPDEGKAWQAVFVDEFDGGDLDRDKWDPYYNWGGNSKDYDHNYDGCVKEDYAIVEDGKLKLKCDRSSNSCGHTYSVGVVNGRFKFTYGYIEGSLKMPEGYSNSGNGLWPAFWTLHGGNWPSTGEIDILEYFGTNDQWAYRVHYSGGNEGGKRTISNATSEFHKYAAYWQPGKTDFYLNDEYVATVEHIDFNNTHYIAINFGIGGFDWLGDPSGNDGNMPLYYETDFVRVWQQVDEGEVSTDGSGRGAADRGMAIALERRTGSAPSIAFTLAKRQRVSVHVHDARGCLVARSEGTFGAGRHSVPLRGIRGRHTGRTVYLCTLRGRDFGVTRRVTLSD